MSVLVDTNVLSELARPRPAPAVLAWASSLDRMMLSAITIDELFFGLTTRRSPRMERWLEAFLTNHCTTLDVTSAIARHAGILRGQLAARGKTREPADMLIAATAAQHGLTLATRNERDFADCGIVVYNPFDVE
jgi:predicted nucleic acid-binding protein